MVMPVTSRLQQQQSGGRDTGVTGRILQKRQQEKQQEWEAELNQEKQIAKDAGILDFPSVIKEPLGVTRGKLQEFAQKRQENQTQPEEIVTVPLPPRLESRAQREAQDPSNPVLDWIKDHTVDALGEGVDAFLETLPGRALDKVGEIGREIFTPGASLGNISTMTGAAENLVSKALPRLGGSVAGRATKAALTEGMVGVPLGVGQSLASGETDLGQAAKEGLLYGGIGGAAIGAAAPVVGAAIKKGLQPVTEKLAFRREIDDFIRGTKHEPVADAPLDISDYADISLTNSGTNKSRGNSVIMGETKPRKITIPESTKVHYREDIAQFMNKELSAPKALAPMRDPSNLDELVRSKGYADITPETVARSYNTKTWYHGTGTDKLTKETLDPFIGSHESLFGQGIYLTDSPSIAEGYAASRGRRGTPTIYEAEVNVDRVLDLERPITLDVADALLKTTKPLDYLYKTDKGMDGYFSKLVQDGAQSGETTEQIITKLRESVEEFSHSSGIPTSEFVENFQDLAINLKQAGYDGLTHTGGHRTGNEAHRVLIMLDPQNWYGKNSGVGQVNRFDKRNPGGSTAVTKSAKDEVLERLGIAGEVPNFERFPDEINALGKRGTQSVKKDSNKRPPESISMAPEQEAKGDGNIQFTEDGRPLLRQGDGSNNKKDVVKRSKIIQDLAKDLNIPIRTGRYRYDAHGIHNSKTGVVRVRRTNDAPTIFHEVGHELDNRHKTSWTGQFDKELIPIGANTSGPGYSRDAVRREGVAEYFRLLISDPAEAHARAPGFHKAFMQSLTKEERRSVLKAQQRTQNYINQPILKKSIAEMSIGEKEQRKLPSFGQVYAKFVDDMDPIKQAVKHLDEKGIEVFRDFALLRGSSGRAQAFLKQGIVDENFKVIGKSMQDVLDPVRRHLDDFRSYIKDKRAIELAGRGIETGSDVTLDQRIANVKALEKRYKHFAKVHQELKEYQDAVLNELVDSGLLSSDDVAAMRAANKEYVPFFRVFEAEAGSGAAKGGRTSMGGGTANQSARMFRIKGSDRDIIDPLEGIVKNTYQYITIAERNRAMLKLVDSFTAADGMGGLVEKVPVPMQMQKFSLEDLRSTLERQGVDTSDLDMDTIVNIFRPSNTIPGKDNIIAVYRGGTREFYQLDSDLYRAVTAADKDQMGMIVRALNFPVRLLRAGVVNTLEFWLKNMWRDQFSAMVNSHNGYVPFIDMIRGMYHVLGKTETFTKFMAAGGAQGLRQSLDRKYLQADLRAMVERSMADKSLNVIKNPLEAMRALSELSELGTRIGEFSKGLKSDASAEGVKNAAASARDLIDFGRAGSVGRNINKVSAFWNAQVQGFDKMVRTFTNPKTAPKAFAKSLAAITAPTWGLYQAYKDDPRYQELQQWDKDMFWHFWVGDRHMRIPIPFELGVVFKVLPERLFRYIDGDETAGRLLGKTVYENTVPLPEITALMPWIQVYANKTFSGSPIVPRREDGLAPEEQAGPYTSTVAKAIARIPGVNNNLLTEDMLGSPRKVDHIIQGYLGSLGKYASQVVDTVLEKTGVTNPVAKPDTGLEDAAMFKAFLGKTLIGNTDSIDRFYDQYDKLSKGSKTAKKNGVQYADETKYKQFEKIKDAMSEVGTAIRAVEADRNMTGSEKTEKIKEFNLILNNLARTGLGNSPLKMEDFFPSKKGGGQ